MIDIDVMEQLTALSEENQNLRRDIAVLSKKLDANNANLSDYMEVRLGGVRDAANLASQAVAQFRGRLDDFTDEQQHFKGEFSWWSEHLDKLAKSVEAVVRKMEEAEASLERNNGAFMAWATDRINMIGRIFRR